MSHIDAEHVHQRLTDREVPWPRPTVVPTTGSTNADVLALAADGAPEGTVVVADEQTAGRGRQGRTWVSDPGTGLWMSVLVRLGEGEDWLTRLPLLAGVAVADAIARHGVTVGLKWPNDVVVETAAAGRPSPRKLAGILGESDGADAIALGIGVNVSTPADQLPVPEATSLALEGGDVSREDLLVEILAGLHAGLDDLRRTGGTEGMAEYRRLCLTIGRDVTVRLPSGEELTGHAVGIADDGRLGVHVTGKTVYVAAGDVIHATI